MCYLDQMMLLDFGLQRHQDPQTTTPSYPHLEHSLLALMALAIDQVIPVMIGYVLGMISRFLDGVFSGVSALWIRHISTTITIGRL